jgi:MoxR-like ATPase
MTQIVDVHFPGIKKRLRREALNVFYDMREVPGLKKKPSTSELLDWLKLLMVEDIDAGNRCARKGSEASSSRRCTARC